MLSGVSTEVPPVAASFGSRVSQRVPCSAPNTTASAWAADTARVTSRLCVGAAAPDDAVCAPDFGRPPAPEHPGSG